MNVTLEKADEAQWDSLFVDTSFSEEVEDLPHDENFEKEYISAITGEELRHRMYQRIDAWSWKEK